MPIGFCDCCPDSLKPWNALETQHFLSHTEKTCQELISLSATCIHAKAVTQFAKESHKVEQTLKQCGDLCHQESPAEEQEDDNPRSAMPVFQLGVVYDASSRRSKKKTMTQVGRFGTHGVDGFRV